MSLSVAIRHGYDQFHLDVRLELVGGLMALVGPSGAGKTTTLKVLAGLLEPDAGLVRLDGEVLLDTAAGIRCPPHRRRLGCVFQEPRLFPHLTVRQNLLYGRWFARGSSGPAPEAVVALLKLGPLLGRRPSRLSGGERQRVALGRALLANPRLLLLDEPLAAVDRAHRDEILPYLDRVLAEHAVPAVYVTHTWSEVAGRADQVVELCDGQVAFSGSVAEAESRAARPARTQSSLQST